MSCIQHRYLNTHRTFAVPKMSSRAWMLLSDSLRPEACLLQVDGAGKTSCDAELDEPTSQQRGALVPGRRCQLIAVESMEVSDFPLGVPPVIIIS